MHVSLDVWLQVRVYASSLAVLNATSNDTRDAKHGVVDAGNTNSEHCTTLVNGTQVRAHLKRSTCNTTPPCTNEATKQNTKQARTHCPERRAVISAWNIIRAFTRLVAGLILLQLLLKCKWHVLATISWARCSHRRKSCCLSTLTMLVVVH